MGGELEWAQVDGSFSRGSLSKDPTATSTAPLPQGEAGIAAWPQCW